MGRMMYYVSSELKNAMLKNGDLNLVRSQIRYSSLENHLKFYYPPSFYENIDLNQKTPFIYKYQIFFNLDEDGLLTEESQRLIKKILMVKDE